MRSPAMGLRNEGDSGEGWRVGAPVRMKSNGTGRCHSGVAAMSKVAFGRACATVRVRKVRPEDRMQTRDGQRLAPHSQRTPVRKGTLWEGAVAWNRDALERS
jgi:hypothetical protein